MFLDMSVRRMSNVGPMKATEKRRSRIKVRSRDIDGFRMELKEMIEALRGLFPTGSVNENVRIVPVLPDGRPDIVADGHRLRARHLASSSATTVQ